MHVLLPATALIKNLFVPFCGNDTGAPNISIGLPSHSTLLLFGVVYLKCSLVVRSTHRFEWTPVILIYICSHKTQPIEYEMTPNISCSTSEMKWMPNELFI